MFLLNDTEIFTLIRWYNDGKESRTSKLMMETYVSIENGGDKYD